MRPGDVVWITGTPMFSHIRGWIDEKGVIEEADDEGNALIEVFISPLNQNLAGSVKMLWFRKGAFVTV